MSHRDREARRRIQDGRRPARDVQGRRRRAIGGRRRQGPGGASSPGWDPRGGRGHYTGGTHRVPPHPAQAGVGPGSRRRPGRHAVRDARCRGPGPTQDGLPGPPEPGCDHRHPCPRGSDPRRGRRHRRRGPGRRADLRDAGPGRLHRGVPAGVRPDACPDAFAVPDELRGRGRPGGPLPARADGGQHAQRLCRSKERPAGGELLPPGCRGTPGRHLRPHDLSGIGDAGRPEVRWLLAGRGRQPPEGLWQEDTGAHAEGACVLRGRLRRHRLRHGPGRGTVRRHRAVRRLRLQQEPFVRLRPDRLPDRLSQGPLSGGVPGGPADKRQVEPGQGRRVPERVPGAGHRRGRTGHQRGTFGLRAGARAGRHAGGVAGSDRLRALRGAQRG